MSEQLKVATTNFHHHSVMVHEVMKAVSELSEDLLANGLFLDSTVGMGGHSHEFLEAYPQISLIGIDQDPMARAAAVDCLSVFGQRVEILGINFADYHPPKKAVLVLADLGVSSPQLDNPARGFSFRLDGPLDMRMNPNLGITAADLISELSESDLADLIYSYGEERFSRRIARKIKLDLQQNGAYSGTASLAYSIAGCFPPKHRYRRIHPATRTFQALRIAVNNELEALDNLLTIAPDWLVPGGLICIISFHSLEDRKVKQSFLTDQRLERVNRKPLVASKEEVLSNPRSRSAKLRIAKRTQFDSKKSKLSSEESG